jgi:excisionase family DNA binding protein
MITYGIEGAAEFLNISPDTMKDLAASGKVAGAKIGKSWVFADEFLAEYLRKEILRQTAERRGQPVETEKPPADNARRPTRRRPATPPPLC